MKNKYFMIKKTTLALAILSYSMGSAYAVLTADTGSIQGRAPVLMNQKNEGGVDLSTNAAGATLVTGDKITLSYSYSDTDEDEDTSIQTIKWYAIDASGKETELPASAISNLAAAAGAQGKSELTLPGSALGAVRIKVEITATSATGAPNMGETITIAGVNNNAQGTSISVAGPVAAGAGIDAGVVAAIYESSDSSFAHNLIGDKSTKLQVGNSYVFKLWNDADRNGVPDSTSSNDDFTNNVTYTWYLVGTSATDNITGQFSTGVTNGNYTVPINSKAKTITNSVDGAQGFSLAVDY